MHYLNTHTDLQAALADLRGDSAALQLLAAKFIKRYPEKIHELSSAFQAMDLPRLAGHIHRLRGVLGIFHATQAQNMAIVLEHEVRYRRVLPGEEFTRFMNELAGVALDLSAHLDSHAR